MCLCTYITLNSFNFNNFLFVGYVLQNLRNKSNNTINEVLLDSFEKYNYKEGCFFTVGCLYNVFSWNIMIDETSVINLLVMISYDSFPDETRFLMNQLLIYFT